MAQTEDPRYPNYGRANYGQMAPNMTAANSQPGRPNPLPQSPMMASLQRAPSMPSTGVPRTGMNKNAVGTFGPSAAAYNGIKNRNQTDFRKGGHQGPANAIGSMLNVKSPFGAALGIQRRAKGSGNDYSTQNAEQILQRGYQSSLGRQASPEEIQSQLAGQGLKGGDRWVGQRGLDAILGSLGQSEEGQAFAQRGQLPNVNNSARPELHDSGNTYQPMDDTAIAGNRAELTDVSSLGASLQPKQSAGAETAYQEYLSEFGPDDPEQPLDFETFSGYFDQLGGQSQASPMADAVGSGRRGWENLLLDTQGEHDSPMAFNGFNMERAMAGGDSESVKDAFARAASTFDIDLRGKSKQEVGEIIGSPEFHQVLAAQGIQSRPIPGAYDQIEVFTKERGWETKDIVSEAGSENAAWWWGDVGGDMSGADPMSGLIDGYDYGQGEDDPALEGVSGDQSALLAGLTGGGNWKSLLEQLLSNYKQG